MRFDPLAYCFRRKNKVRDSENTDIAGDGRILTLRIEDHDTGNKMIKCYLCYFILIRNCLIFLGSSDRVKHVFSCFAIFMLR